VFETRAALAFAKVWSKRKLKRDLLNHFSHSACEHLTQGTQVSQDDSLVRRTHSEQVGVDQMTNETAAAKRWFPEPKSYFCFVDVFAIHASSCSGLDRTMRSAGVVNSVMRGSAWVQRW
jgi:hypothetical protein